jgi:predicted RecA/RadA family phage recombinase
MLNFIEKGDVITIEAPTGGVTSGSPVVVGGMVGIAVTDAAEGENVAVNLVGVYEVTKATGSVSQGDRIYYDEAESEFTTTSAGNVFAGFAWADQDSGDTTVLVKLTAGDDAGATLAQADNVADITSSNLVGVDGTGSNAAPLAGTETRLDAIETKINAILGALQDAGLMASS